MTSSSSAKLDRFKAHLASQRNGNGSGQLVTVNYSETPDWDKEVMRITGGRGAEHIIEARPASSSLWTLASSSELTLFLFSARSEGPRPSRSPSLAFTEEE